VSAPYKLLLDLREATYRQPISSWASKPPVVDPCAANAIGFSGGGSTTTNL
jgi:hypothetical protein